MVSVSGTTGASVAAASWRMAFFVMVKIRNLASDKVIRDELDDATVASCKIES
jgi:hypothetical protein